MRSRIHRLQGEGRASAAVAIAAAVAVAPAPAFAQFQDARLPAPGVLWLEFTPTLLNWTEQFAKDSPDPSVVDGGRELLYRDFDGPLAARLFPGPDIFIQSLNEDAVALGYAPISAEEFSLGDLDYSSMNAQMRRIDAGFEFGVLDRLSVEARAPIVFTEVEPSLSYDSTTSLVTWAGSAFAANDPFFDEFRTALTSIDGLIAGGMLTPEDLATATALRDQADAFVAALERRVADGLLIPTGLSRPGTEMAALAAALAAGFEGFGITLPALTLPETATAADLATLFTNPLIAAGRPRLSERSWNVGEIELGVRFGLIDQITPRKPAEPPAAAPAEMAPPETAGPVPAEGAAPTEPPQTPAAGDPRAAAGQPAAVQAAVGEEPDDGPTLRLRTSIGAKVRIPTRPATGRPYYDPTDFLGIPLGDGQRDIELAAYQDVALGGWFFMSAVARYGIQLADDLLLRVSPPDRPYAFASTQTVVRRDLGDYLELRVSPRLRLNRALSIGLEYGMWRKGADAFALGEPIPGVPDASPLEIETEQVLHRVGLGFYFDLTEAPGAEDLPGHPPKIEDPAEEEGEEGAEGAPAEGGEAGEAGPQEEEQEARPQEEEQEARPRIPRRVRAPWRFAFTVQRAVSGSGGQTPASLLVAFTLRFPIEIF